MGHNPRETPLATPAGRRVRSAWLVPEDEVQSIPGEQQVSLEEFALLGMLHSFSGKSLREIAELRGEKKSWTATAAALGEKVSGAVESGNREVGSSSSASDQAAEAKAASDDRLLLLAQVLTLERLTGKTAKTVLRELQSGQSFESLLGGRSSSQEPAERGGDHGVRGPSSGGHPSGGERGGPPGGR